MNESTINILELSDYRIDFQVIQRIDKTWTFTLEIYNGKDTSTQLIEDGNTINGAIVKCYNDVDNVIIHSRSSHDVWEYAAENALDIVESLGFDIDNLEHRFKVLFLNDSGSYDTKIALLKNDDLFLVKEA